MVVVVVVVKWFLVTRVAESNTLRDGRVSVVDRAVDLWTSSWEWRPDLWPLKVSSRSKPLVKSLTCCSARKKNPTMGSQNRRVSGDLLQLSPKTEEPVVGLLTGKNWSSHRTKDLDQFFFLSTGTASVNRYIRLMKLLEVVCYFV